MPKSQELRAKSKKKNDPRMLRTTDYEPRTVKASPDAFALLLLLPM